MKYLLTHDIGDGKNLGFPSVTTCAALVLYAQGRMYGYHAPSAGNLVTSYTRFLPFALYIQSKNITLDTSSAKLIGVRYGTARGSLASFQSEIRYLAGLLCIRNHIYAATLARFTGSDSAYIEFTQASSSSSSSNELGLNVRYTAKSNVTEEYQTSSKIGRASNEKKFFQNDSIRPVNLYDNLQNIMQLIRPNAGQDSIVVTNVSGLVAVKGDEFINLGGASAHASSSNGSSSSK